MKTTKKRILSILLAAVLLVSLVACGQKTGQQSVSSAPSAQNSQETPDAAKPAGEKKKVAYISRAASDSFAAWLIEEFKNQMAKNYPDYEVVSITDMQDDPAKGLELYENCVTQKVDVIVVQLLGGLRLEDKIKEASDAGIFTVCINMTLEEQGVAACVTADEFDLGFQGGKYAAENLPENAKVVVINGISGLLLTTERRRGFREGCLDARKDVELLAEKDCNFHKDEAMAFMEDCIQKYPQIDGVLCASDSEALGVIEAYKSAGKTLPPVVVGIDGLADACMSIKAGEESASTLQNANTMIKMALELVDKSLKGEAVEKKDYYMQADLITGENVDTYIEMHKANGMIK